MLAKWITGIVLEWNNPSSRLIDISGYGVSI